MNIVYIVLNKNCSNVVYHISDTFPKGSSRIGTYYRILSVYNILFQNIIKNDSVKRKISSTLKRKDNQWRWDSNMHQILELVGKEFKADISIMIKYVRVRIMKEKIGNMGEKLKLEKMEILKINKAEIENSMNEFIAYWKLQKHY